MLIISTKRLQQLVRKETTAALLELREDLQKQIEILTRSRIDEVSYRRMETTVEMLQGQHAQMVEAEAMLRRENVALQQILHGKAQDKVREALVRVAQEIA